MKLLYVLRTLLLSLEALVLALVPAVLIYCPDQLQKLGASLKVNEEVLKFVILLPLALAAWITNESRSLLAGEDKETLRSLLAWPDYWRLKTHFWVAIFYTVVFALISIVPWLTSDGIKTNLGLTLVTASTAGQLIVAFSIYGARIRIRELLEQPSQNVT